MACLGKVVVPRAESYVGVIVAIDGGLHQSLLVGIGLCDEECTICKDEVVEAVKVIAVSCAIGGVHVGP